MDKPRRKPAKQYINVEHLKKTLLRLVVASPCQVTVSALLEKYRNDTRESLLFTKLGYNNPIDLIKKKLVGIFVIQENPYDKRDPILTPIVPEGWMKLNNCALTQPLTTEQEILGRRKYVRARDYRIKVNPELLEDLELKIGKILKNYPDGVWCSDLNTLFREQHGSLIPFFRTGFNNLIGLIRRIPKTVKVIRPTEAGDWKLFSTEFPLPSRAVTYRLPPVHPHFAPKRKVDPEDAMPGLPYESGVFPVDCMQPGETIQKVSISDLQVGGQIKVRVTNIYSPSHLWMQRLDDQYYLDYCKMAEEMKQYYKNEGSERYLSIAATQEGHYCCGIRSATWQRAVIVEDPYDGYVKVRFVDSGVVAKVEVKTLRALKKVWAELPAIALKARLANVKPLIGLSWSTEATVMVKNLVANEQAFAKIAQKDVGAKEIWVHVQTDECESINSTLISKKMANREPYFASQLRYYEFPMFSAIEEAQALSFDEIVEMKQFSPDLTHVKKYITFFPPFASAVFVNDGSKPSVGSPADYFQSQSKQAPEPPVKEAAPIQQSTQGETTIPFLYEDFIKVCRLEATDPLLAIRFLKDKMANALTFN